MALFLGVDGGQSSTTALVGDDTGRVLGRGVGGPCNHTTAEEARARFESAIRASVGAACREAGIAETSEFAAACCGMSGGPEDKREILGTLIRTPRLLVTHDAAIALAGATASGLGIVAIAGTGSMAFGRNDAGRSARAGGWGYLFGDEGGAFEIVRQALRAALRREEGWGPPTALADVVRAAAGAATVNQALHSFYTPPWPRARVAALAARVDAAAEEGDGVARRILENAAQELALLVAAVRAQLWRAGDEVEVAYAGGVFQSVRLRERFRYLVEMEAGNGVTAPLAGPAEGALKEAMRAV